MKVLLGKNNLSLDDIVNVCRNYYTVELSDDAIKKIEKARKLVEKYVDEERVSYGITTGFGKFSDVVISKEETGRLQKNLIISHSCGVGNPLEIEDVRAIMLLRVNNFTKGHSGIRVSTVQKILELLNKEVTPYIPEKGSLGASGDLAPLSHMVLVMLGLGKAYYKGELLSGEEALKRAGISPIDELSSKEGLALINGTQVMTGIGALITYDAINLMKHLDISASVTLEALNGIKCAFDPRLHNVRGHKGQKDTAKNILKLIEGSGAITRQGDLRVQDPYSLRCTPQIHGASKDAINYVKDRVEIEIEAVTDNPIIFPDDDEVLSGGNFHGQPMALPFDFLGIALSEMGNIAERRLERLVNPNLSSGLPAFLVKNGGINSGFMIVQYSAAALVSENKVLSHPASVDSIPSSANQEDHVSMGTIGARKAKEILKNVRKVISMELLAGCQGLDLRNVKDKGIGTKIAYDLIRKEIPMYEEDRVMYVDIEKVEEIVKGNEILKKVEEKIGKLTV